MAWKYPLACLLSFAIAAQIIAAGLRPAMGKIDFLEEKILAAAQARPDIAFVGASFLEMGLDPEVFDAALAKRGVTSRSFNLAASALSVVEMSRVLDRIPCCLRYVVIAPCFACLNLGGNSANIRALDFFDVANAVEFLRFVFSYKFLPAGSSRRDFVANVAGSMLRRYSNLGLGAAALGLSQIDRIGPDFGDPRFHMRRGATGQLIDDSAMKPGMQRDYFATVARVRDERSRQIGLMLGEAGKGGVPGLVTDTSFDFFARLVSALRARNIGVLVINPPNFWNWEYDVAFIARFRARCGDRLPLLDYGDIAAHENLFLPPTIRYDNAHLNAAGAAIWSRELAVDFADQLAVDALNRPVDCLLSRARGPK